ncbi:hypothetical protein OHS33_02970 [Streptomyces sp. NBC_00536]|uniref:hypothetical protein n=1 Tax=Streptomyces sp. NBC_00536 TaxID=2975769 RepID=UPI002E81E62E|nr:hypothetical protein [Streptomyces sp. NBC_00536]WUC77402.1 hypothetical protein OHS33_02970 [Streptomyces sp. NBC_00536]
MPMTTFRFFCTRVVAPAAEMRRFSGGADYLEKEGGDEVNNLVTAARHYRGLPTDQAIEHVVGVVARHVDEFAVLEDSLRGLRTTLGLTAAEQRGVERYVESMHHMMRGYHEWELSTARYLDHQRPHTRETSAAPPGRGSTVR